MQKANRTRDRKITIKAVIFDMDNTLFDFVTAKLNACKAVVEAIGRTDEYELVEYFLNNPIDIENLECIEQFLKDNGQYSEELFQKCCEDYTNIKLNTLELYPNVIETLRELKASGYKLCLVTDAFYDNTIARLKKTELLSFFDVILTADIAGTKKPDPEPFIIALDKLSVTGGEVLLVGDSLRRDINPAIELGILTVYAKYGDRNFHEDEENNADYIIHNISEVLGILSELK